jgi:hypothetical protein
MHNEIHVSLNEEIIRVEEIINKHSSDPHLVNHIAYIVHKSKEAIGELDTQKMINYYNLLKTYK